MNLELSKPTNQVPTRYLNNLQDIDLVIDLIFLRPTFLEFNNHSIHPDWRLISDCAPLTINITILEEHIQTKKHTLVKNSKEKENFVSELIIAIKGLNMESILNVEDLKQVIQSFTNFMNRIWFENSKIINITKHFKKWWDNNCRRDLENYRVLK